MQKKSSQNTGPMLPGMEISEQSESATLQKLILSVEASLARISVKQTRLTHKDLTESAQDYGQSSTASFANYDPATSSWKTSQLCLSGDLEEFSETWPVSGTMQSGKCYERVTSDYPTDVNEFLLLPTPQASDGYASSKARLPHISQILFTRENRGIHKSLRWWHYAMYYHKLSRCYPNPRFVEWMMGFPIGWTAHLEDSETQ